MTEILGNIITTIIKDEFEPEFDFSAPEDVLICIGERSDHGSNWDRWMIKGYTIFDSDSDKIGAAQYQNSYQGFFDSVLEDLIECPNEGGFWVVEGVTASVTRGDGWTTDDDMTFYYTGLRKATQLEIDEY